MKRWVSGMAVSAALGIAAAGQSASAETIEIAELNWAGSSGAAQVIKVIVEDYLGEDTAIIGGDEVALFAGMARNDGTVDIFPDMWTVQLTAQWNEYIAPGSKETVRVNAVPYLGTEGVFVPGYIQEAHGITDISQMNDPEIAKLFDTDGNGKGEYWTGAAGWQSVDYNAVKAKSMGFDEYWEPVIVEVPVFEGMLDAAYKKEEPVLFYYYTPEWIFGAYDLRALNEPAYSEDCHNFIQQSEDPDWFENSEITCAQPNVPVHMAYAQSLEETAPDVAKFMSQLEITDAIMSEWIKRISADGEDAAAMAQDWVESNRDIVEDQWLAGIDHQG
ncbi:MAG: hypothetical protein CMM46_07430 [Rhodospirillaceae bacterium]|nr:hypothetical protein [Rhodospirillaceae bacterium]|tara:strand:+ start:1876 stop:2868 length:993 start_codon:yes stop_codon:yes gene_type:complete